MANKNPKAFGNLLMGIRFSSLMNLILRNGIGLRPIFILRMLVLIPTSLISEFFTIVERMKFGRKISRTNIEKPPVFIIGHWRSGTTFLHQLIFLDSQFTAPTVIQTVIPDHFLFSTKYWVPVLEKMLPEKRPMDDVEMKPLEPMEDEWALLRLGSPTPFLKIFFPSAKKGPYMRTDEFILSGKDLVKWKMNLVHFLKKITLQTGRQIVLKNPFHTPRISMLAEIFPGAKFIHIVRDPYKVVPSAINMWSIVAGENAMKKGWEIPTSEKTAEVVNDFWTSVNEIKKKLPPGSFSEVMYEALEKDPSGEIRRVYSELGFSFSEDYRKNILRFMEEKKNYRKNVFTLSPKDEAAIGKELAGYISCYGYNRQ